MRFLSFFLLGTLALAGCAASAADDAASSEEAPQAIVASAVVVADQAAIHAAIVEADRVRIPTVAGARYRDLRPGTIFAGARGDANGKNPDGFLRRVTAVQSSDAEIVITTTPATLTEAIVSGGLLTSSNGGRTLDHDLTTKPLSGSQLSGIDIDFADKPLFENDDVIEGTTFHESIHLDRAVLSARPTVDVDLRIKDNQVSRFTALVEGNMDTSVRATATVTADGPIDDAKLAALRAQKHQVRRVIYQSPHVPLPTLSIGNVPVSPAIEFTVTLACDLAFGGTFNAQAGVEAKSYVRLGGVYAQGAWQPPIKSDFDIRPSFTIDHAGAIDARCALETQAQLFAYGTSGVSLAIAPYVDFNVVNASSLDQPYPYKFKVDAGASGVMHGQKDVFGVKPEELERALVEWKTDAPLSGIAR